MTNLFARFAKDESGATAIEYGLIAALIAVVIIGAVQLVGTNLSATFGKVSDKLGVIDHLLPRVDRLLIGGGASPKPSAKCNSASALPKASTKA
jgi:pilus assembly protein Flp/PilA